MADEEAGPSNAKRIRPATKTVRQRPLSERELEQLMFCESEDDDVDLQECDSNVEVELSDEDYVPSGPDSYVESESGDSDVQQQTLINVTATTGFRDSLSTPTVPTPPSTPKWSDNPTMKNIPFTKKQEFLVVPDGKFFRLL